MLYSYRQFLYARADEKAWGEENTGSCKLVLQLLVTEAAVARFTSASRYKHERS